MYDFRTVMRAQLQVQSLTVERAIDILEKDEIGLVLPLRSRQTCLRAWVFCS